MNKMNNTDKVIVFGGLAVSAFCVWLGFFTDWRPARMTDLHPVEARVRELEERVRALEAKKP